MFRKRYYYLIKLQYLGFRYHGWQKQPDVNTLQKMVERTLKYVLKDIKFKILACGRTDAKVSANQTFIELFIEDQSLELNEFLSNFNNNLPQDIRALSIDETQEDFNIIQHPKLKEYIYLFCFGQKFHPFAAPYMYCVRENLDIELMKRAAKLFEGPHNFRSYCHRPSPETKVEGEIVKCEIIENQLYQANFFPDRSFLLRVIGEGFKRNQIRLMMGVLIDLGKGKIGLDFIEKTLNPLEKPIHLEHIVPGSGLILQSVNFI